MPDWRQFIALALKAWRETRSIFSACLFITFANTWLAYDRTYEALLARRILTVPSPFEILDGTYRVWGILFAVMGAGCLMWERRQGGSAFSYNLPVRPIYFHFIRAFVGTVQVAILASVPGVLAGLLHQAVRPDMPVPFILSFTLVGIALGLASYAMGYLAGAIFANLYYAIGAGWVSATGISFLLARLSFTDSLAGMNVLRSLGSLPAKPIAWCPVCAYSLIAVLLMVLGAFIAERRWNQTA